jgi:hypothetical protein
MPPSLDPRETVEDLIGSMVGPTVRASAFLRRHLSREQRVSFAARGHFDLASEWGRRYRITEGNCRNVFSLVRGEDGEWHPLQCFCLMAPGVPVGDLLLAQKLLLETNEKHFLDRAVVSPEYGPHRVRRMEYAPAIATPFRTEDA